MLTNQTLSDFTADVPAHDGVGQVAHRRLNALVVLALMLFLSMRSSAKADLPPGWSDADIGAPTEAGSASESNGMWIVSGGGTGLWNGTTDQCNFVSLGCNGDGAIIAQVTSVQDTDINFGDSQAGVMFRNDTTAGAISISTTVTPGQGVTFLSRTSAGAVAYGPVLLGNNAPIWLKVVRAGDQFSGYYSTDGIFWLPIGGAVTAEMDGPALAGLVVSSENNAELNTSIFTNVSLPSPTFGIYRELWTNLNPAAGNTLDALTNTAYNPDWPNNPAASYTHIFTNFETEINTGMNYFGQRLRTFVVPPTNGLYTFSIASDDSSQLFLSPDENPADMVPIGYVPFFTPSEDWDTFSTQQSPPISLQGGCRYYLEAQMQQGFDADENLSVRWQLPNFTFEQPMAAISGAGTLLIPCNGQSATPGIFSQSGNATVVENLSTTFSVLVTNQAPVNYQWFVNGVGLAGAAQAVYTVTNASLAVNNGQVYTCVITNCLGSITSAPISLTVLADTVAPTVAGVFNNGTTNVEIIFSKPVAAAEAGNAANYMFSNGQAISGAGLAADNVTVTLTNAPLVYGSNYAIVINNIQDLASTPNTIAPNTVASFTASPYVPQDIGSPAIPSTAVLTAQGVNINSAGNYIGGYSDQFNFQYQLQTGNFDVTVCLAGLGLSDLWAQAGLMARTSLAADSPFVAALATPGINGEFFAARLEAATPAFTSGNLPVNYPNTWLRLNRVNNKFTAFGSYDGTNWTEMGSTKIFTEPIYLGLAVTSHNTNQFTTAQFVNYGTTSSNAVISTMVNPHEPLGPSSRDTGIVISEIMYKPAPRTDGNNVEFLEIYNSNPFFQDISSYQVTCADMNYTFPANTLIPGGAFFVLAASPQGIANVYGVTSNVFGPYNGSLKHAETLQMLDEQSNVLLTVPYTSVYPWPVAADGAGHAIVLAYPTYGESDPRAWDISDLVGGSVGQADAFHPSPLRSVVINEILPHSENPAVPQFIELYNHSTNCVDVSGCILTDNPATNKFVIPSGTVIGPAGFVSFTQSQFGFTLNGEGETLYFIEPNGSRDLDAVQFGAQADGVSYGRWPDGANDFYAFTTNTPGTNNSAILIGDIVINELMYDPISGNNADQYIELYNQGTNTINLAGWQFTSGVTFTFPANAVIGPNGYVVVGQNIANLFAHYTNLNSGNTYGNYSGKLSHDGALVVLAQPESYFGTNTIYVEEDQVTYGTGGRWGQWSAGGGSSLELIDPHANHRLAANWADSDETQKSSWVDIENTGVLDNGANFDPTIDYAQMGLLDAGECLVDNIEVDCNGTNYVSNGTFENGLCLTNWSLMGCLADSSLENSGYQSSYSLHLRCTDKVWTGDNSCEVALNPNTMAAGQTATLRFQARWLHGWPEVLLRVSGNWLEATAAMPVPVNLGTPGAPNSQYVTNAGPALYNVTHTPTLPAAYQDAVVTTQVHDPDGIQSLTLYYRLDPATNYTAVPMNDNGTGGDAIAGDGVFSATIPGQVPNQIAAFYISATDNLGAATCFPALLNNNTPVREGVIMFGDSIPGGTFGVYHLWITQTNVTRWANLGNLSREWDNDCTFVNDTRVIYNMHGRFAGSPYHQLYNTPDGTLCNYEWQFNADDMFLGTTDFKKIHQPGATPASDATLQRSQLAFTFERALGVPWLYKRYVVVYVNGNARGTLMEDTQVPDSDVVKEHFPNDTDGFLYKMQPWFEMGPSLIGGYIPYVNQAFCDLTYYTTSGGAPKVPRYRYNFEIRRTPDSFSDFTNIFSLDEADGSFGTPNYVANMENIANMAEWMSVIAANHAAGDWDTFGTQNGQNLYGYIGTLGTKYTLLMWDLETVFEDNYSWGPGQNLLTYNPADIMDIYYTPAFSRMYFRALEELVNGPLNVANSGPLLDAKYDAFTANGFTVENPDTTLKPWLAQAQSSIASQVAFLDAPQFSVNPAVVSGDVAYVSGTAPVAVNTVWINGVAWPVTWTSFRNWTIAIPLQPGNNQFNVTGVNAQGQAIAGATGSASAVFNAATPSEAGQVVINEIMYNPAVTNAEYVELYNNSTSNTFNLSGWQLQGVNYTFPPGSEIAPNSFLVLAANGTAFAAAYGGAIPVFDIYPGTLQPPQILALIDANTNVVAEVLYESVPPWPAVASGTSLELMDPTQDNWREGNWAGVSLSPGATNTVYTSLPPFPPLWINEVEADNLTSITNSAGQRTPWLELYNPSSNSVSLYGLYLTDDYSDLTNWAFPAYATINPGQFLVVFADSQTNLCTPTELHTSFTLSNGSGSVALSRLYNDQPQVIDYIDYTNLPPDYSYGSFPDGQSFIREQFFTATPGGPNDGNPPGVIPYPALNFTYTQTFDTLPNPGSNTVDSANPVTINGITYAPGNPLNFASSVADGGLGLSSSMAGWYGSAALTMKLGASAGDQSTGGIISFGPANGFSTNRALGLLATSSTGGTAFAAAFLNETSDTINQMSLSFIGELWRQQPSAKTLSFSYYIDPTGTNAFSTNATTALPSLNVTFPTGAFAAEDGTQPSNQIYLSVSNQPIANCAPAAVLWLVWQMTNSAGTSQGLAIDDLTFSAGSTLIPPLITTQPQSQMVNSGNNPQFTVTVSSAFPVSYQWQENNTNLPGQTNAILALNDVGAGDQASYDVIVSNLYGATVSATATLTVNLVTGLPFIDPQPQSQTASVGGSAAFFISASGSPPLTYQWMFDNANISGATNTSLALANLSLSNTGTYSVQVTDTAGSVNSQNAYLTVLVVPPSILTQPGSQTVPVGATVTLSVSAGGSSPLSYQWLFGNTPLSNNATYNGTTTSALTISNVQAAQTGSYTVIVTNTGGAATSQPAVVNLIPPSYVAYTNAGAIYTQNFDTLPNPGSSTVNTANPVTINGVTYDLANPMDFAYPVLSNNGGLGLSNNLPGWFGFCSVAMKFGASAGDQTTGGIISFGATSSASTNRSLGLLATSTSGSTAFAVRILNQTPDILTNMSLSFTGELWRQQTTAKTLAFSYYIDPTGFATFSVNNITAALTNLNVSFPTGASASGTAGPIQTSILGASNLAISNCSPGAALWLVWQMSSAASGGQGLGIDNLSFLASGTLPPSLTIVQSNTFVIITWPISPAGYVLQFNNVSLAQSNQWMNLNAPVTTNNQMNTVSVAITNTSQFFRLKH